MNQTIKKIEYYDLREEALCDNLPVVFGRTEEMERLTRVVGRRINNNALIVGPSGIGKTTFVYGWTKRISNNKHTSLQIFQFDAEHLHSFDKEQIGYAKEVLAQLPACALFIDNFGKAVYNNSKLLEQVARIYRNLLKEPNVRIILALEPNEYTWLEREDPTFVKLFESITLKKQSAAEYARILERAVPKLNEGYRLLVPNAALREIVSYVERFPKLGQLPYGAVSLLDESISYSASLGQKVLEEDAIAHVVADKVGIPRLNLKNDEFENLKNLERTLNANIINQEQSVEKIARTLQRAKLGLRNPNKPLGSFLLLGPSGVGKTETAKLIAETMFGRSESFMRLDMSEFQQEHTIQRLIGAPAGYIGYEEGGALTNVLHNEPHSLILLDELEKAHPKAFDIFLQVFDDGRLTSGQNETVDARSAIFMATSNIGVDEILKGFESGADIGSEAFIQQKIVPALAETFRLEFINRFDSILVFNPLSLSSLLQIAHIEVKKIEKRLAKHHVQFDIDPILIEEKIKHLADPRFGARPVKRFIEETCETLLVSSLLQKTNS